MKQDYPCSICGDEIWLNYGPEMNLRMEKNRWCFTCDFWEERREDWKTMPPELLSKYFTIEGRVYKDLGAKPKERGSELGYAGRWFQIETDDGRTIKTNNLWDCGTVPEYIREFFPNNARFVTITKEVPEE